MGTRIVETELKFSYVNINIKQNLTWHLEPNKILHSLFNIKFSL